jgi:hypothetical protein
MDQNEILGKIWETFEAGDVIPACAWCDRIRIEDEWLEPARWTLSTIDERMTLSHSICPQCAETQLAPAINRS